MYLLFLDESGTHESSPCLVLAGIAINEHDAHHLQRALHGLLIKHLTPIGLNPKDFELHANEIKNPDGKKHKYSPWKAVDWKLRVKILDEAYATLANFHPENEKLPITSFGVVIDKTKYDESIKREEIAYELILNKFDAMLGRLFRETGNKQRGIVIHDERVVAEHDIQGWTDSWRQAAGRVGQLLNFAEVPLFADSRASRLLQAADLIAYSVWRYYGLETSDEKFIKNLWQTFDHSGSRMHGMMHMTPEFAQGKCKCPPCHNRIKSSSWRQWNKKEKPAGADVTSTDIERLKSFFNSRTY